MQAHVTTFFSSSSVAKGRPFTKSEMRERGEEEFLDDLKRISFHSPYLPGKVVAKFPSSKRFQSFLRNVGTQNLSMGTKY